jgi:hypothetical protein
LGLGTIALDPTFGRGLTWTPWGSYLSMVISLFWDGFCLRKKRDGPHKVLSLITFFGQLAPMRTIFLWATWNHPRAKLPKELY